jgi:starch synthase/alpha-amylase
MTGLIPAMARKAGIPCLFTIHNIHSIKTHLAYIEDRGIDIISFWDRLYFERMPGGYEESRYSNPIELLTCGVFAAHSVNTVSPNFLQEIVKGRHDFVNRPLQGELKNKLDADYAFGILNAPNSTFDPSTDTQIVRNYGSQEHAAAKRENKLVLQEKLGLFEAENAPLFFWPSRLDPVQKGCQLLADILNPIFSRYRDQQLQLVFVADGPYQQVFKDIVALHSLNKSVAVCNFDEHLEHHAYAAADFVLMPSKFEPCGLPQMIGLIYGALPVAHDTGGLHDTVLRLDVENDFGNGFLFETFDSNGLFWAINQAMEFFMLPNNVKRMQIERIMRQSTETFNYRVTAKGYINLYEKMLQCTVVPSD